VEGSGWGRGKKVTLARKPLDFEKPVRPTRVKNAMRMRAFPASGANLPVPPPIKIIRDTKTNQIPAAKFKKGSSTHKR